MRHLIGSVLAVAVAAAVFFGGAWGYWRLLKVPVVNGAVSTLPANGGSLLHDGNVLWAFGALAGTALLIGICAAVPAISPLATGLPGLLLIAITVLYGLSVHQVVRFIPLRGDAFGAGFEALLFNGILLVLGLVMVVPLFIPSRWRWYSRYGDYDGEEEAAPPARQSSLLSSDWAETGPIRQNPPSDIWG